MGDETFSYANLANAVFLDSLYERFKKDPASVDPSWAGFFSGMEFAKERGGAVSGEESRVFELVQAYKRHGHKKARVNPLKPDLLDVPELRLSAFNLSQEDLAREVFTYGFLEEKKAPLGKLLERLEEVFCSGIGFEFSLESDPMNLWISSNLTKMQKKFSKEDRLKIWQSLMHAEMFESFIHTKYQGQTRFSIEGGETLIPCLHFLTEMAAELGVEEILIGMPHRGRLNVLTNVLGKSYTQIFREFEDSAEEEESGDVKYHKGAHVNLTTKSGKFIEMSMAANPSHLESVDPIVEGKARAKQDLRGGKKKVVPLLIHGDASLAGQGIIYETLQLSSLSGYETGGTIHIVMNNQIGYTTLPEESRSTPYCTDIAKTFGFPVLHVNAEKVEECISAILFAIQVRQTFGVDVFIDLVCYRKYGHNEGDEPSFTQPVEYKTIKQKKNIRSLFEETLVSEGVLTEGDVGLEIEQFKKKLQDAQQEALTVKKVSEESKPLDKNPVKAKIPLISLEILQFITDKITTYPEGFTLHPKLERFLLERRKMLENPEKKGVDWSFSEQLAYGSLLLEGILIRLSGQDVCRGTFSQRHAVFVDQENGGKYVPLNHLKEGQASSFFYNSPLSEFGVMGFDLGYSQAHPNSLVLWEAQYGDFVNGAQVIIDQYLASSEQKWNQSSNLTLLLPHGYEGKGPEHSSARIERFLQLAAENNLIIANCSTPAQFFHLLRRQAYLEKKRPLIVFTPKVLLRHPDCVSAPQELVSGGFSECLQEREKHIEAKRLILCSGKVYYDLVGARGSKPIPIVRLEQLYPFPSKELFSILNEYAQIQEVLWVQEEPENMGPWNHVKNHWEYKNVPLRYIGRAKSASPATGSYLRHKKQLESFLHEAFQE